MATCMTDGCCEPATHALKLCVPDRHCEEVAAEGILEGIELCQLHAEEAEDNDLNPVPALVAMLAQVLRFPQARPDMDAAYLTAIRIGCAEHLAFRALDRMAMN